MDTLHTVYWIGWEFLAITAFRMPSFLLCHRTGLLIFSVVLISKSKLILHRVLCTEGIVARCTGCDKYCLASLLPLKPPSTAMFPVLFCSVPLLSMKLPVGQTEMVSPNGPDLLFSSKLFLLSSFFQWFSLLHSLKTSNLNRRNEVARYRREGMAEVKSHRFLTLVLLQRLVQVNHMSESASWKTNL